MDLPAPNVWNPSRMHRSFPPRTYYRRPQACRTFYRRTQSSRNCRRDASRPHPDCLRSMMKHLAHPPCAHGRSDGRALTTVRANTDVVGGLEADSYRYAPPPRIPIWINRFRMMTYRNTPIHVRPQCIHASVQCRNTLQSVLMSLADHSYRGSDLVSGFRGS